MEKKWRSASDDPFVRAFLRLLRFLSLREKWWYSEFFWSVFSRTRTEYEQIVRISPYSVEMQENTDQKNSEYGHFSRSVWTCASVHYSIPIYTVTKLKIIQSKTANNAWYVRLY